MFSKLIATASIAALGVASLAAPALAETAAAPAQAAAAHKALPTPTAQARADGVQPGDASMNWQRSGEGTSVTTAAPLARMSAAAATTLTRGMDISSSFGRPSIATWKSTYLNGKGYKFVWVKATEGSYYTNSNFAVQYCHAASAGLIPGAYHFANPYDSSGTVQADMLANSLKKLGSCNYSGPALPGVLDLEYDPYGHGYCWGLTPAKMVAWVRAFDTEYAKVTGVHPIIYTPTNWWNYCTKSSAAFSKSNVFWLPEYNGSSTSGPKHLIPGMATWNFWQNGSQASPPLDVDYFKGTLAQLKQYATPHAFSVGTHVNSRWDSSLGQPIGPEVAVTAFGGTGYYQNFAKGIGLIASPDGNVYKSSGLIYESWTPQSWGWPSGDTLVKSAQGISGSTQAFTEGGSSTAEAFATSKYGATWMDGAVLSKYNALGGPDWGWPTASISKQTAFGISGASVAVQGGKSIVVSGVGTVTGDGADGGAIFASWSASRRGWPTAAPQHVTANGGGYQQDYTEGQPTSAGAVPAQAYSTSTSGTTWADGAVLAKYKALGGPRGSWGWPTNSDKLSAFGIQGSYLTLPSGRAIITSAKYGTFTDGGGDRGAIVGTWSPASKGWPTSNLVAVRARGISGYQQRFIAGSARFRAFWTFKRPTATWVSGAILARYDALGGTSTVGWPTAATTSQSVFGVRGWIQKFQTRALITSRYGTYASNGRIFAAWRPALRGWPTADLRSRVLRGKAGWIQTFRKGAKVDYAFLAKGSRTIMWFNGAPPK